METTLDSIGGIKVYQRRRGYRFSMDSVLLYAFVDLERPKKIADLGAGSGVVGLLLAKRYPFASVTLVELQEGLHGLSKKNIGANGLGDRVEAVRADIRGFREGACEFDLVVSNPPFRRGGTGRLSAGDEKARARHELELTLGELLEAASGLLRNRGRFSIVYHPERLVELIDSLRAAGLEPKRLRFVHGNVNAEAKMVLLDSVKGGRRGLKTERPLFVYRADGSYQDEVAGIYGRRGPGARDPAS
ncbi:MAG: methyltransferase [Nitrospirota bacterium]|jgi:tRNA1Val (adenine37-N6)-methyltransferase